MIIRGTGGRVSSQMKTAGLRLFGPRWVSVRRQSRRFSLTLPLNGNFKLIPTRPEYGPIGLPLSSMTPHGLQLRREEYGKIRGMQSMTGWRGTESGFLFPGKEQFLRSILSLEEWMMNMISTSMENWLHIAEPPTAVSTIP